MTAQSYSGPIYSYNPFSGKREIYCELYPETESVEKLLFTDLPEEVRIEISKNIKKFEGKFKDAVEADFTIDFVSKKFQLNNIKPTKVKDYLLPRVLIELLKAEIITKTELISRIKLDKLEFWFSKRVEPNSTSKLIGEGIPLSGGATIGYLALNLQQVKENSQNNRSSILYTKELNMEILRNNGNLAGLIVDSGGVNSHAAMISRSRHLPTIHVVSINYNDYVNQPITLDANLGKVYAGEQKLVHSVNDPEILDIFQTAVSNSKLPILANINNAEEALLAKRNNAAGIGLLRTEYIFRKQEILTELQRLLFSNHFNDNGFRRLVGFLAQDFYGVLKEYKNKMVVVRLLDAPLHEFAPDESVQFNFNYKPEHNPMLGNRGARMLITNPIITDMIVIALLQVVEKLKLRESNTKIYLEIPFVFNTKEVIAIKEQVFEVLEKLGIEENPFKFAAMAELPSIFYDYKNLVEEVELISIGTNDLTQTFFGLSRDDSDSFLDTYKRKEIVTDDKYSVLDLKLAQFLYERLKKIRKAKPDMLISLCGEQAANFKSKEMVLGLPIDYISVATNSLLKTGLIYSQD